MARSRSLLSSIRNRGKTSLCHFSLQRRAGWILRTWQTSFCKGGCQGPDPLAASEILYDFHFSLGIHQCAVRDQYMPCFQRRTSRSCGRQDPELLAATNPLVSPIFPEESFKVPFGSNVCRACRAAPAVSIHIARTDPISACPLRHTLPAILVWVQWTAGRAVSVFLGALHSETLRGIELF